MTFHLKSAFLAAAAAALFLSGCGDKTAAPAAEKGADKTAAAVQEAAPVIIYSNADEEAQQAMKNALDANGFKGKYLMQGFGTSELGGKLVAEGTGIEADVVTISTYYLESLQKQKNMFAKLAASFDTINPGTDYYAPILGNCGALFVNTEVLKADNLPMPASIADLASLSMRATFLSPTSWVRRPRGS